MPKVNIRDIEIYYETHGQGKPLVLIAGFSCDCLFWNPILNELAKHFQVIIFDNRGVGRSSTPDSPYTIEEMGEDTYHLIKFLKLDHPHILGHSLGGAIGQSLAYRKGHALDKLVLSNTFCKLNPLSCFVEKNILQMIESQVPLELIVNTAISWLYSHHFLGDKKKLDHLKKTLLNSSYPQSIIGFKRQLEALTSFNSTGWIGEIETHTLVLGGEEDFLCFNDFTALTSRLKNARYFQFPAVAHIPFVEQPELFLQQVVKFLLHQ